MKNLTSIKYWLVILALMGSLSWLLGAEALGLFIDHHRYRGPEGKTIVQIDYQIPYKNLVFVAQKGGFFAELLISVHISNADSLIYSQDFTDNIGISNKMDAQSARKTYLNRLTYLLDPGKHDIDITARDKNSLREFSWNIPVTGFDAGVSISDIELSSQVVPDSTAYLSMFKRKNQLYKVEPSLLFAKEETDYVHLYAELYSTPESRTDTYFLSMAIEQADTLVTELYQDLRLTTDVQALNLKIPILELTPGKYVGYLTVQAGDREDQRQFEFFVVEAPEYNRFLFADPEDEYLLIRYFNGSKVPSDWKTMSINTKRRYINNFWDLMSAKYSKTPDAIIKEIGERVEYANRNFSHFDKGWKTDMGRIYIRNGAPSEVEKGESSDDTRYVRKDYQIWKYQGGKNAVYMFVDMQMNGNARLLYVSGDEMEVSNPKWQNYLGDDFDTSKLSN